MSKYTQNKNRGATVVKGTMKGIIALIMFSILVLGGCVEVTKSNRDRSHNYIIDQINFTIGYKGTYNGFDKDFGSIVNTVAEWIKIRCEYEHLLELDAEYNEQFFVENSLIVYAFGRGWSPVQTEITKVNRSSNELTVDVIHVIGDQAMVWSCIIIIEVAKKDIENVTCLRIVSVDK